MTEPLESSPQTKEAAPYLRMHSLDHLSLPESQILEGLHDEDQRLHRLSFLVRKTCFLFYLSITVAVSVHSPSLQSDLAYWAFVWSMTYLSLDIESELNGPFILATHPVYFQVAFSSFATGVCVMAVDPSLVSTRASRDNLGLGYAWALHICCYWIPLVTTLTETYISRAYLRRRYWLPLSWPLVERAVAAKIVWIIVAPTLLVLSWTLVGNDPSNAYTQDAIQTLVFYTIIILVNLSGALVLISTVRHRSEYDTAVFNLPYSIA